MSQINIFELTKQRFKFNLNEKIKLFEAFSGIGCQLMAFKRLGLEVESIGFSEIDKYAIQSYKAIHGDIKNWGNISNINGEDLPQIDVFTYSFPCTDLSKAGKQKGLNQTRSGLVYEVLRILQELNTINRLPKVLIMENVIDLIQVKFIRDFQGIQQELENLGYSNYTDTLNAKDYGIAQNRDRVFMVSILGNYYYEFPKPRKLQNRLKDYLELNVDTKYYLSDEIISRISKWKSQQNPLENSKSLDDEYIQCITAKGNTTDNASMLLIREKTIKGYAEAFDGDGVYINRPHQKRGVVQEGKIQTLKTSCNDVGVVVPCELRSDEGLRYFKDDIIGTLRSKDTGGDKLIVYDDYNSTIREDQDTIGTLTTNCGSKSERNGYKLIENGLHIRKLTPLECWRLMGIDDKDFQKASRVCSSAQLYKQAGNGIVVNVFQEILEQLMETL